MSTEKPIQKTIMLVAPAPWMMLRWLGGLAGFLLAGLLLAGLVLFLSGSNAATTLRDNFLVLIYQLHVGNHGVTQSALAGVHLTDAAILVLYAFLTLALYPAMKGVHRTWAIVSAVFPWLGLALYLVTGDIGRSGMLAAGVFSSSLLMKSATFDKGTAWAGLLAHSLLLSADISTAFGYFQLFSILLGTGYILLIHWSLQVGLQILRETGDRTVSASDRGLDQTR